MTGRLTALLAVLFALGAAASDSRVPNQNPPKTPPDLPVIKLIQEPIRAVQVLSLDCESWAEVDERFKSFRQAGVNTVIIRMFQNPGDTFYEFSKPRTSAGVYFRTSRAPLVDDLLGSFCVLAHRNNLRIFAWMTTRYADYGIEDREDLACRAYDLGSRRYLKTRGLCVLLPEVRAHLAGLYRDLSLYPIDGILLQDDLILRHNEDFNPRAVELYNKETGRDALPQRFYRGIYRNRSGRWVVDNYTDEFWLWARWKRDKILDLTDELRKAAATQKPGLQFGINCYYETVTEPEHGLAWFSQELHVAAKRDYDFYAIMLYHRQMQKEMGLSSNRTEAVVAEGVRYACLAAGDPSRVLLKLQTVDWDTGMRIPNTELGRMFSHLKKQPSAGWALIPAGKSLDLNWVSVQYRGENK